MEIKIRDVVAFRTEDAKFPAANLLRGGKWISEKKSRSSANDITLHLGEAHLISHIDVGNWGSSFINIEVSRVGLQRYHTLLPSTELMNGRDARIKRNWTSVHMFSKEHFVEDVLEQTWNLVRVTCLQPFLQNEQFGLSFFKIFSIAEDDFPLQQPEPESPPSGSVFAKMRDCSLAKVNPLVVNRSQQLVLAAIEKQKPTLKCSSETKRKEPMATSSSNNGESLPVTVDLPSKENNFMAKISNSTTPRSLNNNNFSQNCVSTLQTRAQTSKKFSSPSLAGSKKSTDFRLAQPRHGSCSIAKIQKRPSPCDATDKTIESVRNTKRRLAFLSPAGSENDHTSVAKVACMKRSKSSGKQKKLIQTQVGSLFESQKNKPEIYDLADSDSDAPQLPSATASPNREMKDSDSDTETIILRSDDNQDETQIEEFVPLEIPSSPECSSSDVLPWDSDAVAGPSRITCPLCSNIFDAASIERHAATCGLTSNTEESICPICSGYFPPDILPRHADLCAERTLA